MKSELILSAAMQVANLKDFRKITRDDVAKKAKVAPSLVSYYLGDMRTVRVSMVERAIKTENLKVLGAALAASHPLAKKAPEALRKAALAAFFG